MNDGGAKSRMENLYEAASLLTDAGAQRDFLQRECPDDPALRTEIEKLLALQPETERFFAEAELATKLQKDRHRTR